MTRNQKIINTPALGDNIRRLRHAANLTQDQVIAKMQLQNFDISRSIYAQIECGTYNIRPEMLTGFRELFQVPYAEFFRDIEVPETGCDYTLL